MSAFALFNSRFSPALAVSPLALIAAAGPGWADSAAPGGVEELPAITVTAAATKAKADGSAQSGYRVDKASVGPLGDKKVLDTPYSMVSVPLDLMVSQQATQINDVVKYDPSAQIEPRGNLDFGRPQTRGFENSSTQNTRIDGMNSYTIMSYPMEAFQSLEILNGAASGLYGASAAGGTFNFLSKRPTDKPLAEATVGYDANGLITEHLETSGQVAGGVFAYRLNALHEGGQSYVAGSNIERNLVSGNFDLHLGDHTKLEVNAYYYVDDETGFPAAFVYGGSSAVTLPNGKKETLASGLPDALDPTKKGYGVIGAGQTLQAGVVDARLIHEFNPDWKLTLGGLWQTIGRTENPTGTYGAADPGNWLAANGSYNVIVGDTGLRQNVDSFIANLNGRATTGSWTHDLIIGANGYQQIGDTRLGQNYLLGASSLANPAIYTIPNYTKRGVFYHSATSGQTVGVIGDTITFNEHWQLVAVGSETWLNSQSFSAAGARTANYNADGFSPTVSLIYKPVAAVTTYLTYADALQQGDTAPTSGVANPGAVLPPYRSKEYEAGVKWLTPNNVELTGAVFRISRPYAFLNTADNTFEADGEQVNTGVEAMARGRLYDSFNLIGGVTYLDPKLENTGVAATSNKLVVSVPRWQANLYVEDDVTAIKGLTLEANLHYTGERAANMQNTSWAAAYATLDLGARYVTRIDGHKFTWRIGVSNVTDTKYWAAILPETTSGGSSQAGAASTVYAAFLGAPRVFHASLSAEF